ncbi:helix-turn-helix domain-containing protein [Neobacillus dielmonensis]|uniref:helix-turn-helix domain-containing protein n=1 Tax=Neobacillus dielmonensis TaxID=1347369 RepID=UPI0006947231|nr:helix-turn-helix domain-containing protein [Neobacillus dielmonensis]
MFHLSFGERLAKCRIKVGLSQAELSERVQISKSTLAMYETNKREPSLATINKLSEKLGVSTDYLISGKEMDISKLLSNYWGAIPHVKEISYNDPIIKHKNIETYFSTPYSWLNGDGEYIWYTPKSHDYITDGNDVEPWVLISLQSEVDNGDLAAVCVNGESAILRRIYFTDEQLTLIPFHPAKDTAPIFCHKAEIKIRGKAIAMLETRLFT